MRINMFDDADVMRDRNRICNQAFKKIPVLTVPAPKIIAELNSIQCEDKEFVNYKNQIISVLDQPKELITFESVDIEDNTTKKVVTDSHFNLETLGVCRYCDQYTIVVDLSDILDLVAHAITGCNPDKVREMPNYSEFSRALLGFREDANSALMFREFIMADTNITKWINDFIPKYNTNDMNQENAIERTIMMLAEIQTQIVFTMNDFKFYIASYMAQYVGSKIRSFGYDKIIVSHFSRLDGEHSIVLDGYERKIKVESYTRFEYAHKFAERCNVKLHE